MDPNRRDPDRRFIFESTVSVPLGAAHLSFLSEIVQVMASNKIDKCLMKVAIDSPSINTRPPSIAHSWVHAAQTVLTPTCKGLPQGTFVGLWGLIPRRFDHILK